MRWSATIACVLLFGACGETTELSQTIVLVDADDAAREIIAKVRVQAVGPSNQSEPTVETNDLKWPVKVVLAPKNNDARRTFTLYIETRDADGERRSTLKLASGFVARQTRYLKVTLHEACVRQSAECSAGTVCNVWDLEVEANDLGRSAKNPHEIDATCDGSAPVAGRGGAGGGAAGASGAGSGSQAGSSGSMSPRSDACDPGYLRTASGCVDVDDCEDQNPCGDHGQCQNTPGDYTCQCDPGYQIQSGTCVASSDCQKDNGGCETTCNASAGSIACSCGDGEWLKADRKACGAFGTPERLSAAGSVAPAGPQVAFDADGNALAVWTQLDGEGNGSLWTRRYRPGEGWEAEPREVEIDAGGVPTSPRVALSAKGRGILVWAQFDDDDGDTWAVVYRDGSFDEGQRIDQSNTGSTDEPVIAIDANGNAVAAWTQTDGVLTQIWVNQFTPSSGWLGSRAIALSNRGPGGGGNGGNNGNGNGNGNGQNVRAVFTPRLSLESSGHIRLVWSQVGASATSAAPWAARYDPTSGAWQPGSPVDAISSGLPDAHVFEGGSGVMVWPRAMDNRISLRASRFDSASDPRDSISLATFDATLASVVPRIALSPKAHGAVIWAQARSPGVAVWADRYDGNADRWLGATELSALESSSVPAPQIAVDPSGDGFGVWAEVRGTAREIKVARLQFDSGFAAAATLSRDSTATPVANSPVRIAVDPSGNAIAIWDRHEMGEYSVWASKFE